MAEYTGHVSQIPLSGWNIDVLVTNRVSEDPDLHDLHCFWKLDPDPH
jgi:hypothetical protein